MTQSNHEPQSELEATAAGPVRTTAVGLAGDMPMSFPCRLGRYELLRELGRGGMGAVYLAEDLTLSRKVALKVPRFSGPDAAGMRERFLREARAAAALDHPHICPIHDFGQIDGIDYLSMSFIEGQPLSRFLRPDRPFSERTAARLVQQIAAAMAEAHAKGIIHRDLKPSNIMMNRRGEPVVMDFGLARLAETEEQRLTRSGAAMGTPAYMPPEQVNGDVALMGPGSDIYALGVILYEALTGRVPFWGKHGELMAQILYATPVPPTQLRPDLSPALEAICLRALAKHPAGRFPDMLVFAEALGQFLAGNPNTITSIPVPNATPVADESIFATMVDEVDTATNADPTRASQNAPAMRARWLWVVAAVTAFVLLIGGVLALLRPTTGKVNFEVSDNRLEYELRVDGNLTTPGPDGLVALAPGPHSLEATGRDIEPFKDTFTVRRGETHTVPVRVRPRKSVVAKPGKPPEPKKEVLPVNDDPPVAAEPITDFRELHQANTKELRNWLIENKKEGFRPLTITTQAGSDPALFGGVAIKDGRDIDWEYRLDFPCRVDAAPYFTEMFSNGYRPTIGCLYLADRQAMEAMIWQRERAYGAGWIGRPIFIISKVASDRLNRARPISLSGVSAGDATTIRCMFGRDDTRRFTEELEVPHGKLRERVAERKTDNLRPDLLSAYLSETGELHFTVLFVEDRIKVEWDFQMDLSAKELQSAVSEKKRARMRPHAMAIYGSKEEPRYAAAWVSYAPK